MNTTMYEVVNLHTRIAVYENCDMEKCIREAVRRTRLSGNGYYVRKKVVENGKG